MRHPGQSECKTNEQRQLKPVYKWVTTQKKIFCAPNIKKLSKEGKQPTGCFTGTQLAYSLQERKHSKETINATNELKENRTKDRNVIYSI